MPSNRLLLGDLASDPDLLVRPLLGPLRGHVVVVVVRLGALGRIQLEQPLHLEAAPVQDVHEHSDRRLELHLARVRPLDTEEPTLWALKRLAGGAFEASAQREQRRVAEKDEPATGAEEARRLRDPAVRVGPDRGAVLGYREVERRIGQGNGLADALTGLEVEPEPACQAPNSL